MNTRTPFSRLAGIVLAAALAAAAATPAGAQAPAPQQDPHDLSGYWDLAVDSRQVPRAHLQPTVTAAQVAARAKAAAHAVRWCNMLGMPFAMDSGRPLNIRQGRGQLFIYTAAQVFPRYVYLDRREHIPADEYDNSSQGDSYGWWEGDTLVVDTVGFNGNQGITGIPGGGFRTESTHLVEKFRLIEDGKILQVVSAWTDPKVFVGTHSYEFRYYRLPETFVPAQRNACNPYDEERTRFLEGPSPKPAAAKPAAAKHK